MRIDVVLSMPCDCPAVGNLSRRIFDVLVPQHRGVGCEQPPVGPSGAADPVERAAWHCAVATAAVPDRVGPRWIGRVLVGHAAVPLQPVRVRPQRSVSQSGSYLQKQLEIGNYTQIGLVH